MRNFLFICIPVLFSFRLLAQDIHKTDLFGGWKIVGYKGLELITPGMETDAMRKDRLRGDILKSKGTFYIDSNGISTSNRNLDFSYCKFSLVHNDIIALKIVDNDYSLGYSSSFDVDSNRASKDFVKAIDRNYSLKYLKVIDTDQKDGGYATSGYATMKICVINTNKIALYRDYDVIILQRN